MELTCLSYKAPKEVVLDPNARDFSRKQNAAVAANEQIKEVTEYQTELPHVEEWLLLSVSNRGKVFKRTRTFSARIIDIRLEHKTFFKLPLFEEVPRNVWINCLPKQFVDSIKRGILLYKEIFFSETRLVVSL